MIFRHRQVKTQGIARNLDSAGDIPRIQTPEHHRHQNVILCAGAAFQYASDPRQVQRE